MTNQLNYALILYNAVKKFIAYSTMNFLKTFKKTNLNVQFFYIHLDGIFGATFIFMICLLAILGVQLTRKYNEKESLERNLLVSICEKLGDFYAKFSPQQALKYYKEQVCV